MNAAASEPVQTLRLLDGRMLAFRGYGDERGRPLIYLHGGGSSRLEPAYADDYARRNGIRIIAIDRPGYGQSSPKTGYSFESVARDVLELADALSLRRFAVAGMSAGAPFALRLAASAPERVALVALINPSPDTQHPLWKRSPLLARLLIRISCFPPLLRYAVRAMKKDPAKAAQRLAVRAGWTQASIGLFKAMVDEGLRQDGSEQLLQREARMVLRQPWQLDWASLQCPVRVICGTEEQSRTLYRGLAQQYPQVSTMDVPGPHMPIVVGEAWDHIGVSLRQALP